MKKIVSLMALVVLFAVPAMALNIKTSKHNLGTTGDYAYKSTNETQICVFCHTPHNATVNVPLWNRTNPSVAGFKLYTSSATLNISNTGKGGLSSDSISLFCLSCHDGVTGLSANVYNKPNGTITMDSSGDLIKGRAALGQDLTNDHPINFRYADTQGRDGTLVASPTGIKFFKSTKDGTDTIGYVECASCHEVHGAGFKKFLRKSNDSSSLCLSCHNK